MANSKLVHPMWLTHLLWLWRQQVLVNIYHTMLHPRRQWF